MGLEDRDYIREPPRGFGLKSGSVVAILIVLNAAIWLLQVIFIRKPFIEEYLACNPIDLFQKGHVWQVLTASFLHAPEDFGHILANTLFLFFFGRELEAVYGKRDFLIFYLLAGSLSILAEAGADHLLGERNVEILGASGAVMGVVVLYTLLFPRREIYLGLMIPVQAWLLCIVYVLLDLSGALGGETGIVHWTHLTGAAFGLLYRVLDLRPGRLLGSLRGRIRARRKPLIVYREPSERPLEDRLEPAGRDAISERIDQLLEKISRSGKESLTPEELEFLKWNSKRYRREGH